MTNIGTQMQADEGIYFQQSGTTVSGVYGNAEFISINFDRELSQRELEDLGTQCYAFCKTNESMQNKINNFARKYKENPNWDKGETAPSLEEMVSEAKEKMHMTNIGTQMQAAENIYFQQSGTTISGVYVNAEFISINFDRELSQKELEDLGNHCYAFCKANKSMQNKINSFARKYKENPNWDWGGPAPSLEERISEAKGKTLKNSRNDFSKTQPVRE